MNSFVCGAMARTPDMQALPRMFFFFLFFFLNVLGCRLGMFPLMLAVLNWDYSTPNYNPY